MATCRARRKRAGPREIGSNRKNGPKVAHRCLSKIWPNAGTSEYLRLLAAKAAVKMIGVQIISRKDRIEETMRNPQRLNARRSDRKGPFEEKVRTAWRHAEVGRNDRSPSLEMEQQRQAKFLVG